MGIGKGKFWVPALAAVLSAVTASQAQALALPDRIDDPNWLMSFNSGLWKSFYTPPDVAAPTASETAAPVSEAQAGPLPDVVPAGVTTQFAALSSTGSTSSLYRFNFTGATGTTGSVASVTQSSITLPQGGTLIGLDRDVTSGIIYAFSTLNNLYTINFSGTTATASFLGNLVSAQGNPVTFAGGPSGFDVNPVTGTIALIGGGSNENLTINPGTPPTGVLSPQALGYRIPTDPNNGRTPNIAGAAYTGNEAGAGAIPQLYAIDYNLDILTQVTGSTVRTVGALGVNFGANIGFDILTLSGIDYTFATSGSDLYTIDLTTGAASLLASNITGNGAQLIGLTALPEPTTGGLAGFAALGLLSRFRRRVKIG